MNNSRLTLEELLSDADFIDYCLGDNLNSSNKWKKYVYDNPEDEQLLTEARSYVLLLTGELPEHVVEAKLQRFKQLFEEVKKKSTQEEKQIYKIFKLNRWLVAGIAASLLLVAGYFFQFSGMGTGTSAFAEINGKKFETPLLADRKAMTLGDGTSVILYPGSRLVVADDFNEKNRKVAVYGQAYFKVAHDTEKAFIVYSKHTTTTAIGTAFYVRDFSKGRTSSVLLTEGRVKVQEPERKEIQYLEPGTALEVDQQTLRPEKKAFNKKELQELTENRLYFENTEMHTVVDRLELYYGVEINTASCKCTFKNITGNYSNRSLVAVLNTISHINNITWKLENQQVEFMPKTNQ